MSRVKIKQQLVYFPRNIRKNRIIKQQVEKVQERPKTSDHRRYFASNGYRFRIDNKPEVIQNALTTLELNSLLYVKDRSIPVRKNTKSFIESCRLDKFREIKIKQNTIQGKIDIRDQNNRMEEFITALIDSNVFFQRLQRTMVQSLALIGVKKKYQKGQKFQLNKKSMGFLLYDYTFIANRGDTLGQHEIFNNSRDLKVKVLQQSAILWIPISNFNILRQQTVKQGFRHEFNKIQTQLRLNFIKKKFPKQ